jgi:hypothetical protein
MREAADAMTPPCRTTKNTLDGASDGHSHACSFVVLASPRLVAGLSNLGYERDALILGAIGGAWEALKVPGLSEDERTVRLWKLSLVIHRILGDALYNHRVVSTKAPFLGVPISLLVDLLANADARIKLLKNQRWEDRRWFHETSVTTRYCESNFSYLSRDKKLTVENLAGVLHLMDVVTEIKEDDSTLFKSRISKRKRKDHLPTTEDWLTPSPQKRQAYHRDILQRAKGYSTGFSSVRDHNARNGGMR